MPEARHRTASSRTAADRDAELAGIDALIDRVVPALTAKLASTHLGELEVREGDWRIRLRRPPSTGWNGELRRVGDKGSRGQPGHDAHGHARLAADDHRVPTPGGSNGSGATAGTGYAAASPGHAGHGGSAGHAPRPPHEDETRRVATSPAVGVFRPGPRAVVGTRLREGDPLGHVDVLGVPEEVPAPADGMVAELLVEDGTAVEYGQELVIVALPARAEAGRS